MPSLRVLGHMARGSDHSEGVRVTQRRKKDEVPIIERSQVTESPPGVKNRFTVVGGSSASGPTDLSVSATLRDEYDTYYRMYRQHPTARAAVEKRAKVMVANGHKLRTIEPGAQVDAEKLTEWREFCRRSHFNQLLRLASKDGDIFGEGFWFIQMTKGGRPYRAVRLHPKYMMPKVDGALIIKWQYGPAGSFETKPAEYDPKFIVHFKVDDPDNDVRGLSLFASLGTTIATDLFAMEYNGRFFENSAQTGTIFLMKDADEAEIERNKLWLKQEYTGAQNAHRAIILEGDIEIKKSVSTNMDMEFLEGRRFNRQEILSTLDIPPEKLGINENSNRSVSKEADNSFRSESVSPAQMMFEEPINDQLIREIFGWDDVVFELNDTSMRDKLEQMKVYADGEKIGVFSPNHIASEFGLPTIDGGDERFIQTAAGLVPVSRIMEVAIAMLLSGVGSAGTPNTNTPIDEDTGMPSDGDGDGE